MGRSRSLSSSSSGFFILPFSLSTSRFALSPSFDYEGSSTEEARHHPRGCPAQVNGLGGEAGRIDPCFELDLSHGCIDNFAFKG